MVASCCSSLLLVDHLHYRGRIVCMSPEFTRHSADLAPTRARIHAQDWPADALAALPEKKGNIFIFYDGDGGRRVETEGDEAAAAVDSFNSAAGGGELTLRGGETTFQRLLEDAGGAVACLDLPEHPNSMSARRRANADA